MPALVGGCVVLAAIAGLAFVPRAADLCAVLNGRQFSPAELKQARQTLRESGIAQTRFENGQLLVPGKSLATSNTALESHASGNEATTTRTSTTGSWFDQFATSRRQRNADDAAKALRLGKLLAQLAGVESAEVVWDEEPGIGRRQAPRVRATVFLKPQPGATIGHDTVRAVRVAVSGSRAHLAADDVLVMDLQRGVTYGPETDAAALTADSSRSELIAACRSRIAAALSDFEGAEFTVRIDAATPPASESSPANGQFRFAGTSGPNLRLEVQQTPVELPVAAVPVASVELQQLYVTVAVPTACLAKTETTHGHSNAPRHRPRSMETASESRRLLAEHEIRQRIARAVSSLPVALNSAQLQIGWDQEPAESSVSVAENTDRTTALGDWNALRSAIEALISRQPLVVAPVLIAVAVAGLLWLLARRRRNGNRRATSRDRKSDSSAHRDSPVDFLPGINSSVWAPLVALEPTSTVAGLLRCLPPDDVAQVISRLSAVQQRDVLGLAPRVDFGPADIAALRRRILAALETAGPESPAPDAAHRPVVTPPFSRRPRPSLDRPAVFEDLIDADDESLRQLTSRVHADTWSAALMGAAPKLHSRLSRLNLPVGRARDGADRRPIRLREIESAQRMIIDEWQALQAHG